VKMDDCWNWQLIDVADDCLAAPAHANGWPRRYSLVSPDSGALARKDLDFRLLLLDFVVVGGALDSGRSQQGWY